MTASALAGWRQLGALLLADGAVSAEHLQLAFEQQHRDGGKLGEVLLDRGWVLPTALAHAVARQHELDYVDLGGREADPALADLLPRETAVRRRALPVERLPDGTVVVAVADPADLGAVDDLRLVLGDSLRLVVADQRSLELALERIYEREIQFDPPEQEPTPEEDVRARIEIREATTSAPVVRLINQVLARALSERASDIHFLPQEDALSVRTRVDGVMRDLGTIPRSLQAGVISRLKVMASLDIAERRAPQDGRAFVRWDGQPLDLRIAVVPTTYGENVVLRVQRRSASAASLAELGMAPDGEAAFLRAVNQPFGAVIVCGPTGSGKTTTLYSALQLLRTPERTLITIEDPVEYDLPGVAQVEVRPRAGVTFASGLRTVLRSDPDVILVGEVRDRETAEIAVQAAMTGHLVLTSLHTQNAASSVERLKDMGIEPSLLSASLNCIIAQRLVRRLCLDCRQPYRLERGRQEELGLELEREPVVYRAGSGCGRCSGAGYHGRVGVYEVMPIQGTVRRLVNSSSDAIFRAAVADGMRSLRRDGLRLVLEGATSVEEVLRVTGERMV